MAAEVSSLLRILNAHKEENLLNEPTTVLITRDLLGSCSKAASANLDLDLQVPTGWEKRLDSKSCKSASPKSKKSAEKGREPPLRDLNVPPPLNLLEESCLELKLLPSSQYQSVCTLDKVKSALERAEKETSKKRSPPISLSSSLTTREEEEDDDDDDDDDDDEEEKRSLSLSPSSTPPTASSGMFAAGCPGCFLYVMTCMKNPNCPRCHSVVPSPSAFKKPRTRIDLNASF